MVSLISIALSSVNYSTIFSPSLNLDLILGVMLERIPLMINIPHRTNMKGNKWEVFTIKSQVRVGITHSLGWMGPMGDQEGPWSLY